MSFFTTDVICLQRSKEEAEILDTLREQGKDISSYEGCGHIPNIEHMTEDCFKEIPNMSDSVFARLRQKALRQGYKQAPDRYKFMLRELNKAAADGRLTMWDDYVAGMQEAD